LISSKLLSSRVAYPILLTALVLGLVFTPSLMVGQAASAPVPVQPQAHAGSNSPFKEAHKEEKKTEGEENDQYRHSPSVEKLAKLLHIDVETAATGFEYINFAVIVLAIGIPLFKVLPKALRKRSETLSHDLESARTATADANARLTAVEAKLAGLDAEINAIRKQVEGEMVEDEARSKALVEEETARIVKAAEQEIVIAQAQAQRGLKQFAADLAIDRAMSRLTLDADTDRALIAEFARDTKANTAGRN
jgi:F-type H+-transporting ATPase subunit b